MKRLRAATAVLAVHTIIAPCFYDYSFAEEGQGGSRPKKVTVPVFGSGPLINVQIEIVVKPPQDSELDDDALSKMEPLGPLDDLVEPSGGRHEFWGDLESWERGAALKRPGSQASRDSLQNIGTRYGVAIEHATRGTRVTPAMVVAVILVESAGRPDAVSHAGAVGLMQLMPATAERFGVYDRRDPEESIRGGVAYLDWLLTEFNGDPVLALAGYNAGENAVKRHRGVPPFSETMAYVPKVLEAWRKARALCSGEVTVWSKCEVTERKAARTQPS